MMINGYCIEPFADLCGADLREAALLRWRQEIDAKGGE